MERVLVSACLLGQNVRYDGGNKLCQVETLQRWRAEGKVMALCPEVSGGFPTPRPPAEIAAPGGGTEVLMNRAKVIEISGLDVTAGFVAGAAAALEHVKTHRIRVAVLKEGSPSCGSAYTYDGTFSGGTTNKPGVTTALLRANGVLVFSEFELSEAEAELKRIEALGEAEMHALTTPDRR
jgi:uncharacterized protein YbbK (DUF523 family)